MNDARIVFDNYESILRQFDAGDTPKGIADSLGISHIPVLQLLASLDKLPHVKENREAVCVLCQGRFFSPLSYLSERHVLCPSCISSSQGFYRKLRTKEAKKMYIKSLLEDNAATGLISDLTGLNRTTIWRVSKQLGIARTLTAHIEVHCSTCGALLQRPVNREKNKSFCNAGCYKAWIAATSKYECNAYGSRMSRIKVKRVFDLMPEHVVHHVNGNGLNLEWDNLEVYANQSDHLKHHRGNPDIKPIWKGIDHT